MTTVKKKLKRRPKPKRQISKITPDYNYNLNSAGTLFSAPFASTTAITGGFGNDPNYNKVTLEEIIIKINEIIEVLNR